MGSKMSFINYPKEPMIVKIIAKEKRIIKRIYFVIGRLWGGLCR